MQAWGHVGGCIDQCVPCGGCGSRAPVRPPPSLLSRILLRLLRGPVCKPSCEPCTCALCDRPPEVASGLLHHCWVILGPSHAADDRRLSHRSPPFPAVWTVQDAVALARRRRFTTHCRICGEGFHYLPGQARTCYTRSQASCGEADRNCCALCRPTLPKVNTRRAVYAAKPSRSM